jgi:hypothetical protein
MTSIFINGFVMNIPEILVPIITATLKKKALKIDPTLI